MPTTTPHYTVLTDVASVNINVQLNSFSCKAE